MSSDRLYKLDAASLLVLLTGVILCLLWIIERNITEGSAILATAFWISAGLNTPHFLISIDLFYRRKIQKIQTMDLKHHFAAWLFPLIFLSLVLLAPVSRDGEKIIQNLHRITTLAILWHFARQSFGVMLLQIHQSGRNVTSEFRQCLHRHLLLLAGAQWLFQNTSNQDVTYFGLGFTALSLPLWMVWTALAASAYFLFKSLRAASQNGIQSGEKKTLPLSAWMTLLCTWAWLAPLIQHPLYIMLLPALHSIQHLSFAIPLRKRLEGHAGVSVRRQGFHLVTLLAVGFTFLHAFVPWLDDHHPLLDGAVGLQGWQYIMATFFNLHHYAIEHALWAGGDGDLKSILLKPETGKVKLGRARAPAIPTEGSKPFPDRKKGENEILPEGLALEEALPAPCT